MRDTLLMIQPFIVVGAQHSVRRNKGTRQINLAAQFWIPPSVRHSDVTFFHGVVHSDLSEHRTLGRGKPRPISVDKALFLRIRWV